MKNKVAKVGNLEKTDNESFQSPASHKQPFWILKGVWKSQNNSRETLHFCSELLFKDSLGDEAASRPTHS